VADDPAGSFVCETLLDLLPDVDVILNVLERCGVGENFQDLLNLFFGGSMLAGFYAAASSWVGKSLRRSSPR